MKNKHDREIIIQHGSSNDSVYDMGQEYFVEKEYNLLSH